MVLDKRRHWAYRAILIVQISGLVLGDYEVIRRKRQQPVNMPRITDLDVTCEKTGMIVDLQFSAPFNGVIFSKGHFTNPSCRYVGEDSGRSGMRIAVPLSGCGTQTVESSTDRLMIENTLIIQVDPLVQDTWDSARKITCDWQSKLEKTVTFAPFGVADMLQVAEVKFAGSGDNVRTRMEIQFGQGPYAAPLEGLTKIGDELTVVIYAEDGGAGYDMMVKNCYAYDGANMKTSNKIRLLNEHGCLFRPHQMEYFKRTFDTRSSGADIIAFARMNAFKFPDKMDVFLSCELELCKGGCDTHCEMDDYPIDIIDSLDDRPASRTLPDTERVKITTFKPSLRKVLKGVKRRRKPKEFRRDKQKDDATNILSPPQPKLSPELLRLLEELGADTEATPRALAQSRTDAPLPPPPAAQAEEPKEEEEEPLSADIKPDIGSNKMSFSTIFAGTHTISDSLPPVILANNRKFQPSQLLSASIDSSPSTIGDSITAISKGASGTNIFPPRLAVNNLKTEDGSFFKISNNQKNAALPDKGADSINFNSIDDQINAIDQLDFRINTLQQQIKSDGFTCGLGSTDPKCNPKNLVKQGGFKPLQSTTPNILSTTLVFTSPRSVDLLQRKLSENPAVPKKVVLQVIDAVPPPPPPSPAISSGIMKRPPRNLNSRPRFGTRLVHNAKKFANFFTSRKRRETRVDNVFAKETVNMVKNFQVVSASDLAFDTSMLQRTQKMTDSTTNPLDFEAEICFAETAFYSGLLVTCSLLLLSGLVSICSIKKVRKFQGEHRNNKIFFGTQSLDSYQ